MTTAAISESILRRVLFVAGAALTTGLAVEIAVVWIADAELARAALAGIAAEALTGREGGIPVALSGGVPPWMAWQLSVTQDLAFFLLVYPFFLVGLERYRGADNLLMRRVLALEAAAQRNRRWADRWGPLGIFVFMLIPFLVNGPLVGGILGRVAGIPVRRLLLPIVASAVGAAAFWVAFFDTTLAAANAVHPRLGWIISASIFALLLVLGGTGWVREAARRRDDRAGAGGDEEE